LCGGFNMAYEEVLCKEIESIGNIIDNVEVELDDY
jgi:hypothetical protein